MIIKLAVDTATQYSNFLNDFQAALCILVVVVGFCFALMIALSLHEMSHAYAAKLNGDPTAEYAGRLTANPFKHFDTVGLVMMFLVGFGWAKPVPVDPRNFNNVKKGMIQTSLAGVITNIILATIFALLYSLFSLLPLPDIFNVNLWFFVWLLLEYFLYFGLIFNVNFFLFNLIPLFPLDGHRFIEALFPQSNIVAFLRRYGSMILIGLIFLSYITESFIGYDLSPLTLYISNVGSWISNGLLKLWGLFLGIFGV